MNPLISLCVTTRNRPALLGEALQSLLRQHYRPLEIIVGDNSDDDASEAVVARLDLPADVTLRYHRHAPTLDVVGNFNWVFDQAAGGRLLLLHDDDLLCDGGLDRLVQAWTQYPDTAAVYGKLHLITVDGEILGAETEAMNRKHRRTPEYAGRQTSNLESGLTGQIAMDGYLMDATLAKAVRFRPLAEVGMSTDLDFGIRAALLAPDRPFIYLDEFVFLYRLTFGSVLRSRQTNYGHLQFLEQLLKLEVPLENRASMNRLLAVVTRQAVLGAAWSGQRRRAFELLCSEHYDLPWLHPATLYRILTILSPGLARTCNRVLRGLPG